MCFWRRSFKSLRERVTNIEWLQEELRHIRIKHQQNEEMKSYDCSDMYSTPSEIERSFEYYNMMKSDIDSRERQIRYFIDRISTKIR